MAKNNMVGIILVVAAIWLISGQSGNTGGSGTSGGTTGGTSGGGIDTTVCPVSPTVTLQQNDKYDSSLTLSTSHLYKLNGGISTTDTDGSFGYNKGDTLHVLWGNGNSTYYNYAETYELNDCGPNKIIAYKGPDQGLVENTSLTVQCFNQENVLIDDAGVNETVASGDEVSLNCEILGVSQKGMPLGGVMVVELNGTSYIEADTKLAGDIIKGAAQTPGSHANAISNGKTKSFDVDPILDTGTRKFTLTFKAESTVNPSSGAGEDIYLSLYSKNGFRNKDTDLFETAVEDEDGGRVGWLIGAETVQID